jgi:glutamate synthase (NADPH) small chain
MGKPTGFLEYERHDRSYLKVKERVKTWNEFVQPLTEGDASKQGARCMDCGVPFCHNGCPVNNMIPDWNNLVYLNDWRNALEVLHSTNNFPEFTGRICPAPCEEACTLNINDQPVTIKTIECSIVDKGWAEGWIVPQPPVARTGKRVAVIGSGPAGMAAAQQLARAGHAVVLFEKQDRIGGLLRYGIPDFKMEKHHIDRRMAQMAVEGVEFRTGAHIGIDIKGEDILAEYDAVVVAAGAEQPRDLEVPGRELKGVHFAMDFLTPNNKKVAGDAPEGLNWIDAKGKHVIVIGGGDTGSDCIGTSFRMGAKSVTQLEILPQPPESEDKPLVWPYWPLKMRTSSSQEEGAGRDWAVLTKKLSGKNGMVDTLHAVRLEWVKAADGRMQMQEMKGSDFTLKADLVLLAMGFTGPVRKGLLEQLDGRGNVAADTESYETSVPKVFASGDARRGQSLVVWAIREGRQAARAVDHFLMGRTDLPR